jgi:hypothetical protein
MDRFLKHTTQKEPALTASFLAAVLLATVARYFALTDEDLAILGPVAPVIAGVVIRVGMFSPATVDRPLGNEERARGSWGGARLSWLPAGHFPLGALPGLRGRYHHAARVRL